jgi:hypothetical protein
VGMLMLVGMLVFMGVLVIVGMFMLVLIRIFILVVGVDSAPVNAEFHAFDLLAFGAFEVHVEIAQVELGKLPFESGRLDSQVAQSTHGHIAADA